jgi:RNA polymerase sigma-70 factor (ECF subfamily)
MGMRSAAGAAGGAPFLDFYDDALPQVYGYLSMRCGPRAIVEDLTAETFLAAVDAARRDDPPPISLPWIIGVARHKLVDHWRRQAREERRLSALADVAPEAPEDFDARLDAAQVRQILDALAAPHRAALTLRYLDDLPVAEVAALLGRTLHATEALLVRARSAFRRVYLDEEDRDA